jgi:acetyl-CoA carboxylase carboxyl transferase subunit alpha
VEILLELHGDRGFKDDKAMIGGLGKLVVNLYDWSTKGYNTKTVNTETSDGKQKDIEALRLMKMAEKFGIPVLTLDTRVLIQGWKRKNADKVSYRQKYI